MCLDYWLNLLIDTCLNALIGILNLSLVNEKKNINERANLTIKLFLIASRELFYHQFEN